MRRLLKEPLLHFLLVGAGIFIAYNLSSEPGSSAPRHIVVTEGRVEHLATGFARTWQRPPTDSELAGLIDDWVRDEIATREATALGLGQDDTVIRRRLRQKLEFVSEDIAAQAEPTDADLDAYLHAHSELFRVERRLTFSQVYLDPAKHGDNLGRDSEKLLAQLQRAGGDADSSTLGDSLLLEHTFQSVPASEIAKQFGDEFAAKLGELALGRWQGPVESGYGVHLVLVRERTEGRLPALADVREAVRRERENARRVEANETFYEELSKRYTVTIEGR
ncbi:MAG TPA: peptidylprolyl isomerase [Candidatus Binatia bacterium]|nr:peptidylprolyl isomerase [Candidatus Binatia bacterium]